MDRKLYLAPYSYKSVKMSVEDQIATAARLGFNGLEGGELTDEYISLLKKYNMGAVVCTLTRKADGTADENQVARLKEWGVDVVQVRDANAPPFSIPRENGRFKGLPFAFGTVEQAIKAAKKANIDAEFAARYGFKTCYHNHTHEFRMDQGKTVLDTYLENTVSSHVMELDVGWVLTAGVDPIGFMKKYPGRIGAIHIKACNWVIGVEALGMICPNPPLEIGITEDQQNAIQTYAEAPQGPIKDSICDWGEVIKAAEAAGCHTFIVERERVYNNPPDVIKCLQEDHDWIRKCMAELR